MAGIRPKNTKIEMAVRTGLHRRRLRFSLHRKNLPGCPDIVLRRWRAVILVHGCFWHGHDCHLFKWPKSDAEEWRAKIEGNRLRDARDRKALADAGWRVLTIWECSLRGRTRLPPGAVIDLAVEWLTCHSKEGEIRGGVVGPS